MDNERNPISLKIYKKIVNGAGREGFKLILRGEHFSGNSDEVFSIAEDLFLMLIDKDFQTGDEYLDLKMGLAQILKCYAEDTWIPLPEENTLCRC